MAYVKMDDFLKKYYKQLHFNAMPSSVRAQFLSDRKKGLLTPKQEQWVKEYMHLDGDKYVENDLPDPSKDDDLAKEEAEKLFAAFQIALAGMKGAAVTYDKVKDADILAFLNHWFGEGKVFNVPKATDECKDGIDDIVRLLSKNDRVAEQIKKHIVENTTKSDGKPVFEPASKLDELLDKCKDGKYNTDKSVQDKIKAVAHTLNRYLGSNYTEPAPDHPFYQMYKATLKISEGIEAVDNENAFSVSDISDDKLKEFREDYAPELLQELYYNKGLREKFAQHDTKKITEKIDKAEGNVSWHDPKSDDYVKPKIDDVLNPIQQVEKWTSDTYNDTIKKYEELRGGHLFFSVHAKEICKAIDKEKIKPADGLNSLLDKAESVKKRISNTVVKQHFDWFIETMNDVKNDIPKAIEGCWKDARQMKCVIQQIILKATDPRNNDPKAIEKAKTAMEIMTVMKYGLLTSKVMDAMKQTDFNMFSDGKLSWNKNEGIQFITKAFDQSIKAAFLGVGYGITFVRNKIMMSGMEFTNQNNQNGPLQERINELNSGLDSSKKNGIKYLNNEIDNAKKTLQKHKDAIKTVNGMGGIGKLTQLKADYETKLKPFTDAKNKASAEMETYQKAREKANKTRQRTQQDKEDYEAYEKIATGKDIAEEQKKITDKRAQIAQTINEITAQLNAKNLTDLNGNPITNPDSVRAIREQLAAKLISLQDEDKEQQQLYNQAEALKNDPEHKAQVALANKKLLKLKDNYEAYIAADTEYNNADLAYEKAEADYNKADQQYQNLANALGYEDLSSKVSKFQAAKDGVKEMNETIDKHNKAINNWDKEHINQVIDLENHWNWLQSGDTTTWALSLSNAQEEFDAVDSNGETLKDRRLLQYIMQNGLTA